MRRHNRRAGDSASPSCLPRSVLQSWRPTSLGRRGPIHYATSCAPRLSSSSTEYRHGMPRYTFLAPLPRGRERERESRAESRPPWNRVSSATKVVPRFDAVRDRDFAIGGRRDHESRATPLRIYKVPKRKSTVRDHACEVYRKRQRLIGRRGRPATGVHGQLDTAANGRGRLPLLGFVTRGRCTPPGTCVYPETKINTGQEMQGGVRDESERK